MKYARYLLIMPVLILMLAGCTKKDNLTGTNWSELEATIIRDNNAVVSGYSFAADSLDSMLTKRKALLVGRWNGSEAQSILRFTNLLDEEDIQALHDIRNIKLELVLNRSSLHDANPVKLKFYQVKGEYRENPFEIPETELFEISQAAFTLDHTVISSDTLRLDLPYALLQNWQTDADTTGLNIVIKASDEAGFGDGFVDIRLTSGNVGSKISYEFKNTSSEESYSTFTRYAGKNDYFLNHTEAPLSPGAWRISNYRPQRMYVDFEPDMTVFRDMDGNIMATEDLKRVSVNKAEMVLFVNKQHPSMRNAITYEVAPLLIKNRPETPAVIATTDMFRPEFFMPLNSYVGWEADSLVVDITPVMQAYVSQKTFADGTVITPQGIVLMSGFERKDFGELEFYHPLTAPEGKKPYIRIKYTPPFL